VPKKYEAIDERGTIRIALDTDCLTIAREKRNRLAAADEALWQSSLMSLNGQGDEICALKQRHKFAQHRALALGFTFKPIDQLIASDNLMDIVERVEAVAKADDQVTEAEVLLGTIIAPKVTIREALDLYLKTLSIGEQKGKSPDQLRKWRLPRQRAIEHFISVCGNLPMEEIERSPNSANRDLGNLRKLYRTYWTYEGQEERQNPFRELRFLDTDSDPTPPFSDEWVKAKILAPGALDGLHEEAKLIVKVLIETGCRPSEVANLEPEDIHLDVEVPFISIRPKANRELKSRASKRKIPLVGVALEAMREAPNGFPHYQDKSSLLSASLMKAFKSRGLLEFEGQRIYSFRHAFEKRMLEAGLDYGLRCTLMGHKNNRPEYGDGGSLAFRRTELMKICHSV